MLQSELLFGTSIFFFGGGGVRGGGGDNYLKSQD